MAETNSTVLELKALVTALVGQYAERSRKEKSHNHPNTPHTEAP